MPAGPMPAGPSGTGAPAQTGAPPDGRTFTRGPVQATVAGAATETQDLGGAAQRTTAEHGHQLVGDGQSIVPLLATFASLIQGNREVSELEGTLTANQLRMAETAAEKLRIGTEPTTSPAEVQAIVAALHRPEIVRLMMDGAFDENTQALLSAAGVSGSTWKALLKGSGTDVDYLQNLIKVGYNPVEGSTANILTALYRMNTVVSSVLNINLVPGGSIVDLLYACIVEITGVHNAAAVAHVMCARAVSRLIPRAVADQIKGIPITVIDMRTLPQPAMRVLSSARSLIIEQSIAEEISLVNAKFPVARPIPPGYPPGLPGPPYGGASLGFGLPAGASGQGAVANLGAMPSQGVTPIQGAMLSQGAAGSSGAARNQGAGATGLGTRSTAGLTPSTPTAGHFWCWEFNRPQGCSRGALCNKPHIIVPCPLFAAGTCHFSAMQCHFKH